MRGRLALAAVVLVLVTAAVGCGRHADREPISGWWVPAVLGRLEPALGLGAVATGAGDVWVDDIWAEQLLRLDGAGGQVVARVPVDGRLALAAGDDAIWALQAAGGYGRDRRGPLLRIAPRSNRVVSSIALRTLEGDPLLGFGVLAGGDDVWVWGPRVVLRVNAAAGVVVQVVRLGEEHGELTGAALVGGGLVATTADGHLAWFDRGGVRYAAAPETHTPAALRAAAGDRLIVAGRGRLLALDARSGRVLWRTRLGDRVAAVIARGPLLVATGSVLDEAGDRLWTVDARAGRVLHSVVLPTFSATGIAAAGGTLWVACADGTVLVLPRWLTRRLESG